MSLWHADGSKKDNNSGKLPDLPELEPLPELDDLFDEFDSEGLLSDNEKPEVKKVNELPKIEEDELPRDDVDTASQNQFEDDSVVGDSMEDDEQDIYVEQETEEEVEEFSQVGLDKSEDEIELGDYDEDIGVPDMSFEEFATIDEKEVNNPEYDIANDEEVLSYEDDEEDPYGYDLEEDGFSGSLLPGVDLDEDEPESQNYEEDDEPQEEVAEDNKNENKSGFKELDEEKVKAFFMGLLAKLKGNKDKKSTKINKDKKPSSPKSKNKLDKTKLIFAGVAVAIVVLLGIMYLMWGNSYKNLDEIETAITIDSKYEDDIDIKLNNISINEERSLNVDLFNSGDISQDFTVYLTIKDKPMIPLLGNKVNCESDIISIEPGGEVRETFACNGDLSEDLEYKVINVEVDKL